MVDIAKHALSCSWLLTWEIKLVKADCFGFVFVFSFLTVHILGNAKGETFAPRLPSHLISLQLELLLKVSTISASFLWSLLLWGVHGRGNPQKQFQSLLPSIQHSLSSLNVVRKLFAFGSLMSFLLTLHVEMTWWKMRSVGIDGKGSAKIQAGAEAGLEGPTIRQAWAAVELQPQCLPQVFSSLKFGFPEWTNTFTPCRLNSETSTCFGPGGSIKVVLESCKRIVSRSLSLSCKWSAVAFFLFCSHLQIARGLGTISVLFLDEIFFIFS